MPFQWQQQERSNSCDQNFKFFVGGLLFFSSRYEFKSLEANLLLSSKNINSPQAKEEESPVLP